MKEKNTRYKSLFKEMATVGRVKQLTITVHSDDHKPAHFHLDNVQTGAKNRFLIPLDEPKKISDFKLYKGETLEFTSTDMKTLLEFLNEDDTTGGAFRGKNWIKLSFAWNLLHPDDLIQRRH